MNERLHELVLYCKLYMYCILWRNCVKQTLHISGAYPEFFLNPGWVATCPHLTRYIVFACFSFLWAAHRGSCNPISPAPRPPGSAIGFVTKKSVAMCSFTLTNNVICLILNVLFTQLVTQIWSDWFLSATEWKVIDRTEYYVIVIFTDKRNGRNKRNET